MLLIVLSIIVVIVSFFDYCLNILNNFKTFIELRNNRSHFMEEGSSNLSCQFILLIPLFKETEILPEVFKKFCDILGSRADCQIIFITNIREVKPQYQEPLISAIRNQFYDRSLEMDSTPGLLHHLFCVAVASKILPSNIHHVININAIESKKYAQLMTGLKAMRHKFQPTDFVGVYDADSIPDPAALDFIKKSRLGGCAFQQIPLYLAPTKYKSLNQLLAHSRIMHNFQYMLSVEVREYFRSLATDPKSSKSFGWHLTGHGEFVRLDVLEQAGGFLPPSCDSTLGFSLGLLGYGVYPIPIPDISLTPNSVKDIFWQGVVWYNGVSYFAREQRRLNITYDFSLWVSYLRILDDHLRWGLYPFVVFLSVLTLVLFFPQLGILAFSSLFAVNIVQDVINWIYYNQMCTWTPQKSFKYINLLHWMELSLIYFFFMRWVWSISPWYVHLTRLFGRELSLKKTSRV